ELFAAGKFSQACDIARSAAHRMRRNGGESQTIDEAAALADAAEARKPEEFAAMLADWRDAKPGARFPSDLHNSDRAAFLRLSPDGRRVETSQGAEVPVRVFSLMWHLIG